MGWVGSFGLRAPAFPRAQSGGVGSVLSVLSHGKGQAMDKKSAGTAELYRRFWLEKGRDNRARTDDLCNVTAAL